MRKEDLKYLKLKANRVPNKFLIIFDKTTIRRDSKKNITRNSKGQNVESHFRPRPEWLRHIQEVMLETESK